MTQDQQQQRDNAVQNMERVEAEVINSSANMAATESSETDKIGSVTQSSAKKTAADELLYLSRKYRNCSLVAANYSKGMKYGSSSITNIVISPQFLAKIASNPELEAEHEGYITDMQNWLSSSQHNKLQ